jgi:tetratricopeptide (TPR) repeat protein
LKTGVYTQDQGRERKGDLSSVINDSAPEGNSRCLSVTGELNAETVPPCNRSQPTLVDCFGNKLTSCNRRCRGEPWHVLRDKGDHDGALRHLQRAIALDPKMTNAHFKLAAVSDEMCNPNSQSRDVCQLAIREYETVLRLDSSHEAARKNLAYLLFQLHRLDESEHQYRTALALHAEDAEVLCAVGALDFLRTFQDVAAKKGELNLSANEPLIHAPACNEVRSRNIARIEEGIALLSKSLQIDSHNLDAMGHLSSLYTERADIQCGDPQAYRADMNTARRWDRQRSQTQKAKTHFFQKCPPGPPPMRNDLR